MVKLSDVMTPSPLVLPPDTPVDDARRLADARGICHLPIVEEGALVGMLCLCDLDASGPTGLVCDYMTTPVVSAGPDESLERAAAVMRREGIGSLAVVAGGELVGIVTREDLRRADVAVEGISQLPCVACGCHQHVWETDSGAPICVDCRERVRERLEEGTAD